MKKKLSFLLALMFILTSLFMLSTKTVNAAELTDAQKIEQELNNVVVPQKAIIDFPVVDNSVYGSTIKWESSNTEVLNVPENGGWVSVTRPTDEDKTVTLTLTISRGVESKYKTFDVLVPKGATQTNRYSISYVLNGGVNNSENKTSYNVGENVTLLMPTKGTVRFLGWYDNKDFNGKALTSLPKGTSGDVTLYAKWEPSKVIDLEVTLDNVKTEYNALERFDSTNIKVVKVYNDSTKKDALASELSFDKDVLHGNDTVVTLTCEGISKEINVKVHKLNYDLSGIIFKSAEKEYNGFEQSLSYDGTLPEGLSAQVVGTVKNVTSTPVTITLKFTNDNTVDYNDPTDLTQTLTITKARLNIIVNDTRMNVGGQVPTFTVRYDGFKGNDNKDNSLSGTLTFSCDATSESAKGEYSIKASGYVSDNYEISYKDGILNVIAGNYIIDVQDDELNRVYNKNNQMFVARLLENGVEIPNINFTYVLKATGEPFTGATNAGDYVIVVSYDSTTYGTNSQEFTLHIAKATISMVGVTFENATFEYDGLAHDIKVKGTLPAEIKKVNYNLVAQTEVDSYSFTATFEYDTTNYNVVDALKATLTIKSKTLEKAMFEKLPGLSYTGSALEPEVKGTYNGMKLVKDKDFTVEYQNNTDKGTAKVYVTGKNNYTGIVTLEFEIGDSDLEKVQKARQELENSYGTVLSGVINDLPETLPINNNNNSVNFWLSSSTALSVDASGNVNAIFTNVEQIVTLYVLIMSGDAAEYASFTFKLGGKVKLVDTTTKVEVDGADSGTTLDVKELNDAEKSAIVINQNDQLLAAYDINLMDSSSQVVMPSGEVTVKLPIPVGADTSKLVVYHVKADGTLENMNGVVVDGYIVFTTSHFSTYIITTEKATEEKGTETNPYTPEEALALIKDGKQSNDKVYVKGIITKIDEISTNYGNATFYLGSLQVFRVNYLNNAKFTDESELIVGDEVVIYGVLKLYNKTSEITDGYVSSVKKIARENFTITVSGDKNGAPTVNKTTVIKGEKVIVTFNASEGYEVATIKINNNDPFDVVGDKYELTIIENTTIYVTYKVKQASTGNGVTIDFTKQGYSNAQDVTEVTVDGVTVNFDKATGSTPPRYYTSGTAIRLYAKNTFTLTSSKAITKVVITFGSSDGNTEITVDSGTFTTNTWVGSAKSIKFTLGDSGQRRLVSMVVTVDENSQGGDDPTPVTNYTVTFDVDGDTSKVASQTVESGKLATKPTDPAKEGFTFKGWLLNDVEYDFSTPVTGNITLMASWQENSQGGVDPTPSASYILLDDITKLVIGSKIIIVNNDATMALGTDQKTNNRGAVSVSEANGMIIPGDTVQVIEIVKGNIEGTFAFKVDDGYLYAASSSSNYLRTQDTLSDNSSWKIEIKNGVASITAQGTNTNNQLKYNNSSKLFSCYGSGQVDVKIYILSSAE